MMANQKVSTIRRVIKETWFYSFAVIALIFVLGCPDSTAPGGADTPTPAATITIGAAGNCPGGDVTIQNEPRWTQISPREWQLTMAVCVKCPDPASADPAILVGVTGATVTGEVNDETFTFLSSLTSTSGVTGPDGCVTLTKQLANAVKTALSGKRYLVNFQDVAGNPLHGESVNIPP